MNCLYFYMFIMTCPFFRGGGFLCLTCYFACLMMEVIRRAPHEFKIACLEVTTWTQSHVTMIYNMKCYWKASYQQCNTYDLKLLLCRISKNFSLLTIIHSTRDLEIEIQMNLVTERLGSRRAKYLLLTLRCASWIIFVTIIVTLVLVNQLKCLWNNRVR